MKAITEKKLIIYIEFSVKNPIEGLLGYKIGHVNCDVIVHILIGAGVTTPFIFKLAPKWGLPP